MKHLNPCSMYSDFCANRKKMQRWRKLSAVNNDVNFDVADTNHNASQQIIDFSSNDYLGLSFHNDLLAAAYQAGQNFGVGSTGSRLLSGNCALFENFEKQIALDKSSAAALIFNSGYQANTTILAALCNKEVLQQLPLVFFDKLNHASLYTGVQLSGAQMVRYHHNDMTDLHRRLTKYQNDNRPKFIVTETLFGMDGDVVSLAEITKLAAEFKAFLYLDEAHATGMFGERGYGLANANALQLVQSEIPYVIMGTFSKGVGVCGAYVACSMLIKEYLINKCSGFIYSTALSPMIMGAAYEAWKMVETLSNARKQLLEQATYVRSCLRRMGFDTGLSTTHIIPIILGEEQRVLQAQAVLLNKGVLVSAVRPPTVPSKTARLRIALNVKHNQNAIEKFLAAMQSIKP